MITATTETTSLVSQSINHSEGERFELTQKSHGVRYKVDAWNSANVIVGRLEAPPVTAATAYIPTDSPGYADGRILVGRIEIEGHGHHEEALRQAIERAEAELAFMRS